LVLEYERHGTTTLFAALETAIGLVKAGHYKRRRRRGSFVFLNRRDESLTRYSLVRHDDDQVSRTLPSRQSALISDPMRRAQCFLERLTSPLGPEFFCRGLAKPKDLPPQAKLYPLMDSTRLSRNLL